MISSLTWRLCLVSVLHATFACNGFPADSSNTNPFQETEIPPAGGSVIFEQSPAPGRDWSVQFGVSFISDSDVHEILGGDLDRAKGDGGGQIYSLMVNWTAYRFEIPFRERILKPQFEPYLTLALVDENSHSLFPDYKGGVGFRWVDFPWDRWVETTFFMGIGLSYSSRVYTIDRERHPGEERSHLKFDWPIQFTFAPPRWPQHQLVVFNDHISGGHVFDEGGVNSVGIGYRLEF
jgi:hypothetical protein